MLIGDNTFTARALSMLCMVLAIPAMAQAEGVADANSPAIAPVVGGDDILSLAVSLLLVIGSIILVGWLYARLQGNRVSGGELIRVIESRSLGAKERIVLVDVADKQILVGMTASTVQTLHVFDEPVAGIKARTGNPGFAARLRTAIDEVRK